MEEEIAIEYRLRYGDKPIADIVKPYAQAILRECEKIEPPPDFKVSFRWVDTGRGGLSGRYIIATVIYPNGSSKDFDRQTGWSDNFVAFAKESHFQKDIKDIAKDLADLFVSLEKFA